MLYKVILTFKSMDETLVYDRSSESYWAVLSCGTVYYAVQHGSNVFKSLWTKLSYVTIKWKLLSSTVLFIMLYKVVKIRSSSFVSIWNIFLQVWLWEVKGFKA